jgi:hypothetical protein
MSLFPYVVEYEAEQEFGGGLCHNSADHLSKPGAQDLFNIIRSSPRVTWARWFKVGEPGDRAEYWRS